MSSFEESIMAAFKIKMQYRNNYSSLNFPFDYLFNLIRKNIDLFSYVYIGLNNQISAIASV